jgi:hypothetical protein
MFLPTLPHLHLIIKFKRLDRIKVKYIGNPLIILTIFGCWIELELHTDGREQRNINIEFFWVNNI